MSNEKAKPNQCGGVVYLGSIHPPHTWTGPHAERYYCDGGNAS